MRWVLGVLTLLLCQPALGQAGSSANVHYGPDRRQNLLIFPARGPGPHPMVLFAPGGAWTGTGPGMGKWVAPMLNAAGYTVASANYRLVPQVTIPQAVQDVADAAAYMLRNAGRFGIDPARFALAGHSSGGNIAALLATDPSYLRKAGVNPSQVAAVLLLDGVYDLKAAVTHFPTKHRLMVFGQDPAFWARISPSSYVATMTNHPRFCLAHEDTFPYFIEQAGIFVPELRQRGQTVDEITVPGLTHSKILQMASDAGEPIAAFATQCLHAALPAR